ncbi:histidine kinase [Micromonospora sp. WMMD980]|uniref:sensor histidine kinase n=1 Tax=Micromonospora sp. WMMD980 TaxID=3016088 RepID=UPI0024173B14|nr:histidine kinase [Micromonospora sp. WMMD980]MDG4800299.1 histidine kinase [Micromonospora sp. WMMD980]
MTETRRPAGLLLDLGLAVVFALGVAVTAVMIADSWGTRYAVPDVLVGVVVCALALARRRGRVRAAAAGLAVAAVAVGVSFVADLPQEPGPVSGLALAVLVGSVVRARPRRTAAAVAGAGLLVIAGSLLTSLDNQHGVTAVTVLDTLCWLAAVAVGVALRRADARARAATERVRRDERLDLARELHDVVTHHVTGIVVQAQAAQIVAARQPRNVPEMLAAIELSGADALAAMRRVVGLLRDADDGAPASPGPERLTDLVARFGRHGPPVRLRLPEDAREWPPEVTTTVHRVVQEALTNVSRHAPHAGSVTVTVDQSPDAVAVEVEDDAPPAPARVGHRDGYGLVGMRERVHGLGGTLRAGPRAGRGWSVRATLPLPARTPR